MFFEHTTSGGNMTNFLGGQYHRNIQKKISTGIYPGDRWLNIEILPFLYILNFCNFDEFMVMKSLLNRFYLII